MMCGIPVRMKDAEDQVRIPVRIKDADDDV